MPKKQVSNFGHLMEILNISAIHMSNTINIDKSSISKWRTGKRSLLIDAPYFKSISEYLIKKNETIGGKLLEDFFASVYPEYDPKDECYLSKCIRNYILNFESKQHIEANVHRNENTSTFSTLEGIDGRRKALAILLEKAEQMPTPQTIIIYTYDQLEWYDSDMTRLRDMKYLHDFYRQLKKLLNMNHKLEFILSSNESNPKLSEAQNLFIELAFYDNVDIYIHHSRLKTKHSTHLYLIPEKMVVTGYCLDDNYEQMCSFIFNNSMYAKANQKTVELLKSESSKILNTNKLADMRKILEAMRSTVKRSREYYFAGKTLSHVTMSEDLLLAILTDNNLSKAQIDSIFEGYHLFRAHIENAHADSPSGFYYVLEDIMSKLSYSTTINYSLSASANKLISVSRERYLQHFRDTAELLLRDNRYKVILHYTKIASIEALWCCGDSWSIAANNDESCSKAKVLFSDDITTASDHASTFKEIFFKLPQQKKNNAIVAELFLKIANGEKI